MMGRVALLLLGSACTLTLATPVNVTATPQCASKRVSFEYKFMVHSLGADQDRNGNITADEFINVARRNDANNDGLWTEQECVNTYVCALGDTTLMAQFSCEQVFWFLTLRGIPVDEGKIIIKDIQYFEETTTEDFVDGLRAVYERFVIKKCLNKCLQIEEKLNLMVDYVDLDKNGRITNEDVKGMLTSIDTDENGWVDEEEYVVGWVCRYGDPYASVRFAWNDMGYTDSIFGIKIDEIDRSPISVRKFKALHRDRYARYERAVGPAPACEDAVSACTRQGLAPSHKAALHQKLVDVSPKDGFLSEAEVAADLNNYWDVNGDSVLTERECVSGTECRYGDITTVATSICSAVLGNLHEKAVLAKDFVSTMKDFKKFMLQIYKQFETNKCTKRCLADDEKADQEALDLDQDGDGHITREEASEYLRAADRNGNNQMEPSEFVQLMTCKYGSSITQALYRAPAFMANVNNPAFFPVTAGDYSVVALSQYLALLDYYPDAALDRPCTEQVDDDGGDGGSSEEGSDSRSSSEDDD